MSNVASLMASAAAKRATSAPAKPKAEAPASAIAWDSIDPAALPEDIRELFFAIGRARSAFETAMSAFLEPPAHLKLVFAYKRGLAIGLAPKTKQASGLEALMARLTSAE